MHFWFLALKKKCTLFLIIDVVDVKVVVVVGVSFFLLLLSPLFPLLLLLIDLNWAKRVCLH